jgi:hypothetical protein
VKTTTWATNTTHAIRHPDRSRRRRSADSAAYSEVVVADACRMPREFHQPNAMAAIVIAANPIMAARSMSLSAIHAR